MTEDNRTLIRLLRCAIGIPFCFVGGSLIALYNLISGDRIENKIKWKSDRERWFKS